MQQRRRREARGRLAGSRKGNPHRKRLFRRDAEDRARKGIIPRPPDFSAPTHQGYRTKLKRLVELVTTGDVRALKREAFRSNATSPRALGKFRDLALLALKVQQGR